jgi:zinc protease
MKNLFLLFIFCMAPHVVFAANKVQEIKTPGGFTIWLVEEHSLPIINANVSFTGAGLAYDPTGKEGRGNMTAALLMEGAGSQDSKAFNEVLENDAIRMNISADDDTLHASVQTLSEHKDTAFSMLADALIRPRFDADAIGRTRSKMQAILIEQSESPYYKLSRGWQESAFAGHPYARMGLGTKETLEALRADDFKTFTGHYITKENIVISVVGDITADEISAVVDKRFISLPEKYTPDSNVPDVSIPSQPDVVTIEHQMPQTMVTFGLAGLRRADPDYLTAYVVNHLIGGNGLSSRFGKEIRVKRGLAYSVNTQLMPKAHAGVWRGMFSTRNAEVKNAIAALRETLANYAKNGVAQAELDDAKAYLTGSFILDLSSNYDVANFLTIMQLYHLGSDYLDKRNSMIEKITLADIKRVSERFMDPAHLRIVIVGKPDV